MTEVNLDKYTLEGLAKLQKAIATKMDDLIAQDAQQLSSAAEQLQLLTQSMLGNARTRIPKKAKETVSGGLEEAKETLLEPVIYRHPDDDTQTWTMTKKGDRKPRWLRDLIKKEGWSLEDLKVSEVKATEEPPQAEQGKEEAKPEEGSTLAPEPSVMRY
jgi:hypothetical protein